MCTGKITIMSRALRWCHGLSRSNMPSIQPSANLNNSHKWISMTRWWWWRWCLRSVLSTSTCMKLFKLTRPKLVLDSLSFLFYISFYISKFNCVSLPLDIQRNDKPKDGMLRRGQDPYQPMNINLSCFVNFHTHFFDYQNSLCKHYTFWNSRKEALHYSAMAWQCKLLLELKVHCITRSISWMNSMDASP